MLIVLAHSHANTFGGGERAVLEVGRALMAEHDVRLLLGGFDSRRTYPELASLPFSRFGRLQWPTAHVSADAIVTTFNEWMESTQIEPSVQYGDEYLQITRQNADQYRAVTQGNG